MVFKDSAQAKDFIRSKELLWKKLFVVVTVWNGQDVGCERIAALKIIGVPLLIRDNEVFEKIGELFGRKVWNSNFSWNKVDNSYGDCFILTSIGGRIEEEINVIWKCIAYSVWVVEEMKSWVPVFVGEPESSSSGASMQSVESEELGDGLEEGEFQPPPSGKEDVGNQNMTAMDNTFLSTEESEEAVAISKACRVHESGPEVGEENNNVSNSGGPFYTFKSADPNGGFKIGPNCQVGQSPIQGPKKKIQAFSKPRVQ